MTKVRTLPNEKKIVDEIHNEELIKRTEIPNSPFVVISTEKGHFGTFGKYKITEDYGTIEEAIKGTSAMTWNRLIQIMSLVTTILTENK